MTHYAFLVALPVTDVGVSNEPSSIPARFELTSQGGWWVVYSEPAPVPVPNGNGNVRSVRSGKPLWVPRRSDSRSVLGLRAIAHHTPSSRAVFVATSTELAFLKWAKAKADAAGFLTWTRAEYLEAIDAEDPQALWLQANADPADLQAVRQVLAGMATNALDTTTAAEIAGATAIEE